MPLCTAIVPTWTSPYMTWPAVGTFGMTTAGELGHAPLKRADTGLGKPCGLWPDGSRQEKRPPS
jgi:hypothetical protein